MTLWHVAVSLTATLIAITGAGVLMVAGAFVAVIIVAGAGRIAVAAAADLLQGSTRRGGRKLVRWTRDA